MQSFRENKTLAEISDFLLNGDHSYLAIFAIRSILFALILYAPVKKNSVMLGWVFLG